MSEKNIFDDDFEIEFVDDENDDKNDTNNTSANTTENENDNTDENEEFRLEEIEEFEEYYEVACGKESVSEKLLQSIAEGIMSNEVKLKNCPYKVDVVKINRIVGLE